jgi:hypothetical protein
VTNKTRTKGRSGDGEKRDGSDEAEEAKRREREGIRVRYKGIRKKKIKMKRRG